MKNDGEKSFRLSPGEKVLLLETARKTVESIARTGRPAVFDGTGYSGLCLEACGAFVTLHLAGELRGCIGIFESDRPLWETIREMAEAAAFRDPRFPPVTASELESVEFEISVLSPLRQIRSPEEIHLGEHGIYIRKGMRSGTFLPQVARETGWNLEEFLGHCSADKAGLGWDGWKSASLYVYTADVFNEKRGE